jgi:hypothetical protein
MNKIVLSGLPIFLVLCLTQHDCQPSIKVIITVETVWLLSCASHQIVHPAIGDCACCSVNLLMLEQSLDVKSLEQALLSSIVRAATDDNEDNVTKCVLDLNIKTARIG